MVIVSMASWMRNCAIFVAAAGCAGAHRTSLKTVLALPSKKLLANADSTLALRLATFHESNETQEQLVCGHRLQ